jgi:hypothetical protein
MATTNSASKDSKMPKPDGKPLVFISASTRDLDWENALAAKLSEFKDQIDWWNYVSFIGSKEWDSEIEAAIERTAVAIVLLSRAYLESDMAKGELLRFGEEAEFKKLTLFPIVLEECPWQQYRFLRNLQIWNDAKPIGPLSPKGVKTEMEKVARHVVGLLVTSPPSGQVEPLPEFEFSPIASKVLENAKLLADRSNRGGITSSCLLFALANIPKSVLPLSLTPHFVWTAITESGSYNREFEAFLKDGNPPVSVPIYLLGLPGTVSENAANVITHASRIARDVGGGSAEVHTRHLFAALITVGIERSRSLRDRLNRLGVHVPQIKVQYRKLVHQMAPWENATEWDSVLQITQSVDFQETNSSKGLTETVSTTDAPLFKKTYSAFIPDRASYGSRATGAPLDDSLGVRTYASHLAQLIAAKDTFMPLSIGLFGAWGAGKSHFIDLLDEELCTLTQDDCRAFHKSIVQIRFNAWHYLDTNLWANLVSEIFDQLFKTVEERGEKQALEKLKDKLRDQSALAAEAKAALALAQNVREQAERQLSSAMKARAAQENTVSALLDDLKNLVVDDALKKQLHDVAEGLGLPKVESSFKELEARAEEVRSVSGRMKALLLAVFTGPGWWKRGILLAVALAAPLAVAWLAVNGGPWFENLLAGAGRTIAQLVTAMAAISAWLATQARAGDNLVSKLETAYDKVAKVRAEREATDDAARAQAALEQKKQAEEQARQTLHDAEEKLKTIQAELAEMAPGRQLMRFLRERATAEDYRRHLGLVSLVRRDFEQLSELLTVASSNDGELPKIDRIVLYIDDLDRCRADRVIEVLEAVHLLLAFPLFAVVVAVDPRWLRQSLLDHYPRLLGGNEDDKSTVRTGSLGRPATPQDYLEKIFQVPFNLHAMEKDGFESLVKHLFTVNGGGPKEADIATDPEAVSQGEAMVVERDTFDHYVVHVKQEPSIMKPEDPEPPPAPAEPEPPSPPAPIDPERLVLTQNEIDDVQRFQLLFQTPRAVKRLANTYSLIRVGVAQGEWDNYLGHNNASAAYRVPLLLLAVTSAFPALARPWLLWLRETSPTHWQLDGNELTALADKHRDTTDRADWEKLHHCMSRLDLEGWPAPDHEALAKWVPRVARYSF